MRIDASMFESVQRRIGRLVPDVEELSFTGRALAGGETPDWLIKLSNGPMLLDNAVNEIADAAVEYLSCAVIASVTEHAERIDAAVVSAASAAGGECEGLAFHIKGRESLARKIHDDGMLSPKGYRVTDIAVIERVANGVKDALRYTIILPFDGFPDAYDSAVAALASHGMQMARCKNTLGETDGRYRGVNTNLVDGETGIAFEVQFHTADSFDTKQNKTHVWYERERNQNLPEEEREKAREMQRELFMAVPTPAGIDRIKSF